MCITFSFFVNNSFDDEKGACYLMVKGVSKTVIVVNNTGNKYFEKIVFYVTPEYGNLSAGHLNSAATKFISTLDINKYEKSSLRKRCKKNRIIKFFAVSILLLVALTVILAVIL